MDAIATKIIAIVDRLSHPSTSEQDCLQTIAGLRRTTKGEMASKFLENHGGESSARAEVKRLRQTIETMHAQLVQLEQENDELRVERQELENQLQIEDNPLVGLHEGGDFTYEQVMIIFRQKFGKHNGPATLWADYSAKLHAHDPESPLVTPHKTQMWRKSQRYPAWAVDQLQEMPVTKREIHVWSNADVDFLRKTHLDNPFKTDEELARACSERFGCTIKVNSIKSKFNELRLQNRIPKKRPTKPAKR